jgi:hypothetical protein
MYEAGYSIDPVHIILFLNHTSINQTKNLIKTEAISNDLCSIILLPFSAKNLVDKKYHDFMNKCTILQCKEKLKKLKKNDIKNIQQKFISLFN